jgi:hypothetical protein
MLVDAAVAIDWVQFPSKLRQPKPVGDVDRCDLFELTMGVGFKFPIEAALQKINPIEIPKAVGIQDRVVMSLE